MTPTASSMAMFRLSTRVGGKVFFVSYSRVHNPIIRSATMSP